MVRWLKGLTRPGLVAHCEQLLAAPMPDPVLWTLLDSMARMVPLEPAHRRVCVICSERFYVEQPAARTPRTCSKPCEGRLKSRARLAVLRTAA